MTEIYEQEKNSKKKFLIPLVILLLCGVAFTGAAYAYSSQVTVDNNTITNNAILLELKNTNAEGAVVGNAADEDYSFTVNWTSVTKTNASTKAVETTWTPDKNTSVTIPVSVTTNVAADKLVKNIIITISGIDAKLAHSVTCDNSKATVTGDVVKILGKDLSYTNGVASFNVVLALDAVGSATTDAPTESVSTSTFKVEATYNSEDSTA